MLRNHNFNPPKKKLPPLVKVKLSTVALSAVLSERMTEEDAGRLLREATGTQWSLLTCVQYLSGKEARGAITQLPEDWVEDGMTKQALEHATKVAAFAVANAHPEGTPLCASDLAKQYRGRGATQE
ncbi:hypothetical protein D7Y24_10545 [Stenotrophomonas maltophilia]|uniref:hypothetical protein n=1 Tax=Stenotrophomonas maltophilia TaxID=40324 RepID=UPI0015DEF97B|nr:hypothetical protein [Stenotrophomonas maltophilia]MBA0298847.1 hypothetical protein [Stenotrophomonas maltophilia]